MRTFPRSSLRVAVLVAAGLLLGACGSGSTESADTTTTIKKPAEGTFCNGLEKFASGMIVQPSSDATRAAAKEGAEIMARTAPPEFKADADVVNAWAQAGSNTGDMDAVTEAIGNLTLKAGGSCAKEFGNQGNPTTTSY